LKNFFKKFQRKWLISDEVTAADFQFYEYVDACWLLTNDSWSEYPNVLSYMKRFQEIPELQKYLKSQEYTGMPINAIFARFGGKVAKHEQK